jgi:hypothetical protein
MLDDDDRVLIILYIWGTGNKILMCFSLSTLANFEISVPLTKLYHYVAVHRYLENVTIRGFVMNRSPNEHVGQSNMVSAIVIHCSGRLYVSRGKNFPITVGTLFG